MEGYRSRNQSNKKKFFLNESFVKRTITTLENKVEKSLMNAKRKEFNQRVSESVKKPPFSKLKAAA